jgi:hypothetical protein
VLVDPFTIPGPLGRDKQANYDRLADLFEQHADLKVFEELYLA